ncbi:YcjF family protein [Proteus terrae]|uniref:YcjF family protein n=1 Tax=Proteus terrae TaxID=1574161 RepID=UPI000BFDF827|nr:YcjF family protein [Proteus terrae]ATN00699.1 TIGR01620 family protein [Proteus vulgaris]MBJ2108150.1 TIGR01620 family protein [Proteus terrae]MBJ2132022.1 TIGR01620 family protein [Proteus terrae]MCO7051298.1 YcjF family protein [Proteus terrae]MCW9688659.1 YcjF family protein [Proteus terrae]
MNEPLKSRIDFKEPILQEEVILKKGVGFNENEQFLPIDPQLDEENEGQLEGDVQSILKPKKSVWKRLLTIASTILGISVIAQTGQWIYDSWINSDWIALGAASAGGLIVVAGIGSVITEWRRIYRLRQRADERDKAKELLYSHAMGNGRPFCEKLAKQAGIGPQHPALIRWQSALHDTHNDKEVLELYSQLVQPILDKQARAEISRSAAESTLMIAVSPLAMVDMAFIGWRNIRLINRIAEIYGIELGYYSRLKLFRLVLVNIAFAGATELVREVGMDWLSQDLAARLSTRAAQGIGAGLLTARLGIKAMELCRPLPWIDDNKPKLGDFRKELIGKLKTTISGKKKE